jgi:hypothetical protein
MHIKGEKDNYYMKGKDGKRQIKREKV